VFLLNPNVPLAVSKSTQTVKLCSNEITQFLTGDAG